MTARRRYASLSGVSPRRAVIRRFDHRAETRNGGDRKTVAIEFSGVCRIVPVLNRSTTGLLIHISATLRIGEQMCITFSGGRRRQGIVCWFHSEKAGIRLLG